MKKEDGVEPVAVVTSSEEEMTDANATEPMVVHALGTFPRVHPWESVSIYDWLDVSEKLYETADDGYLSDDQLTNLIAQMSLLNNDQPIPDELIQDTAHAAMATAQALASRSVGGTARLLL